ncbi:MAG: helix-turn-helix transcriptional regulator [Phycisphaerales bacterium]
MIRAHRVDMDGARVVLMSEGHYESLCRAAGRGGDDAGLPDFPRADKRGNMPALEFARVSIARDLIRARRDAGLSQQALAALAGLRQETLSRIETAKHSATPATVAKIERAIARACKARKRR